MVLYEDEAAVLQGIKDITPHDGVEPYISFIKQTGKPIGDWSWDGSFLRNKGKIFVPGDEDLRQAVLYIHHDSRMGGHRGSKATLELIS